MRVDGNPAAEWITGGLIPLPLRDIVRVFSVLAAASTVGVIDGHPLSDETVTFMKSPGTLGPVLTVVPVAVGVGPALTLYGSLRTR